jgi:hypothetical protein
MRSVTQPTIQVLGGVVALLLVLLPPFRAQDARSPERDAAQEGAKKSPRIGDEMSEEQEAAALAARLEERLDYFRVCDSNENGWISFREAQLALDLDRTEYRNYDRDGDGRVSWEEFERRYAETFLRSGGVLAPDPELLAEAEEQGRLNLPGLASLLGAGGFPTPDDLLLIFDRNKRRGLDYTELDRMFRCLTVELSPIETLARMDVDTTGELELGELQGLSAIVRSYLPKRFAGLTHLEDAEVYPLFYASPVDRMLSEGSPPMPPMIPGPVTHFRRLDLDDSGFVNTSDLNELLTSSGISARPSSILAAIDLDGDGRVDEREFLRGLGAR